MEFLEIDFKRASQLRRQFFKKYSNQSNPFYSASTGYGDFYGVKGNLQIWEAFNDYKIIPMSSAIKIISSLNTAFIAWDRSPSMLSRSLQKSRMISATGKEIADNVSKNNGFIIHTQKGIFRPETLYIFDSELSNFVVFTNLSVKGIGNICLTSVGANEFGLPHAYNGIIQKLLV